MGLKYTEFFDDSKYESSDTQIIICKACSSHLCLSDLIISDQFRGASGEAYLVDSIINFQADSKLEKSKMTSGEYLINKVRCQQCKIQVGWTYKKSFSYEENYKEGKFVIEKAYLKLIPNNSSTDVLFERAKKERIRRRLSGANSTLSHSSASSISSASSDFKMRGLDAKVGLPLRQNSVDFRDVHNGAFLSTLRFLGIDKDDFEEDKEDVFVDV